MQEIINQIVRKNLNLFKDNPCITKVNIGFTNTIYSINDTFIVKICSNIQNEKNFKNEIEFYLHNALNPLIPKLYYYNLEKKDIPYYYEILEKAKGVSLYQIWHTFNEKQREEVIKQICLALNQIHSTIGASYDWASYIKEIFMKSFSKAQKLPIFNEEELQTLTKAYSKFSKYLTTTKDDFVLIHNDLHFDNIIYHEGQIKLIDFERSLFAPRDFELDIFYKMVRKPWKFASEMTEKYTNLDDYKNIMIYVKKYYPKIVNIPFLDQRLAIYDIVYFLEQYVNSPKEQELKKDVIKAAQVVLAK